MSTVVYVSHPALTFPLRKKLRVSFFRGKTLDKAINTASLEHSLAGHGEAKKDVIFAGKRITEKVS